MRERRLYYVYILASQKNGTLYIGITNSLIRRIGEHKEGLVDGFTKKYKVNKLMYYEIYGEVGAAIYREKRLKDWKRKWKLELIEKENPDWKDLYEDMF
jgi:putative endonuclease